MNGCWFCLRLHSEDAPHLPDRAKAEADTFPLYRFHGWLYWTYSAFCDSVGWSAW